MEELLNKWKARRSDFRAKAEEAMFGSFSGNLDKAYEQLSSRYHWETCIRQWDSAIEELEEALNDN